MGRVDPNSLVAHLRGWESIRETDRGHLWEHLVLDELLFQFPRRTLHYWRDKSRREIDFVVDQGSAGVLAIEAKIRPEAFETKALTAFRQAHPIGQNFVVCPHVDEPFRLERDGLVVQVCRPDRVAQLATVPQS